MKKLRKSTLEELAKEMPALSEKEMQWIRGGSYYYVNQSGEIFLSLETLDSSDILSAYNGDSIEVGKGILSQFTSGSGKFEGPVNINNIFNFLMQHTDVEWSMTRYIDRNGSPRYHLGTSHSPVIVSGYIPEEGTEIVVTHNHPGIYGQNLEMSDLDKETAMKNPTVTFIIRNETHYVKYIGLEKVEEGAY